MDIACGTFKFTVNVCVSESFHFQFGWVTVIFNALRPRQDGCHFPDDIFKCIFLNENVWILNEISLKFVPWSPINNITTLVQIMAWRRPGYKPLSEPIVIFPTHRCVTRPQWVNTLRLRWTCVILKHNKFFKIEDGIYFSQWNVFQNIIKILDIFFGALLLNHCGLVVPCQHRSWSTLVQIMACYLCSDKPLPESMLTYCQFDPLEQIAMKFW